MTCTLAGNAFAGVARRDSFGAWFLDGPAKYTWTTGVEYEGPFVNSSIEGYGKFSWPDGSTFCGEVSGGKRHGRGVYVAADKITTYDGDWFEGKRHGHGRLTYDTQESSYYEGQWEAGQKHGKGRQVWPSGNVYEGHWKQGTMSGQGTMLWCDGPHEHYSGHWEQGHPHGEGCHKWLAPERSEAEVRDGPSQQMNNRYTGQWQMGVRQGAGVFYYANGSKYSGIWQQNVKQGHGRYSFEDGRVYDGPFEQDQMTDYIPPNEKKTALNIGAEDNPIRRCIDISDLEPVALPPDVGFDLNVGSGYDEGSEVMREVHNMLLRYLTELKHLYFTYRLLLHDPAEDPFVLTMHQLWMLMFDIGIITPTCSLSRLNRLILTGARHQLEVAPGDGLELRPLTPRLLDTTPKRMSSVDCEQISCVLQLDGSDQVAVPSAVGVSSPVASAPSISQYRSSFDAISEVTASETSQTETPEIADQESHQIHEGSVCEAPLSDPDEKELDTSQDDGPSVTPEPLSSKFWRLEDAVDLDDIHQPSRVLMFRHFLESVVRMAVARFPHEKGLEHQVRRVFKERILPHKEPLGSLHVFSFLMDVDIQNVMREFRPALWRLFKLHATGEGEYGPPQWRQQVVGSVESGVVTECRGRASGETNLCGVDSDVAASPNLAGFSVAPVRGLGEERHPFVARLRRRGFGGQQRRVHVGARLDVTIRIKDLLQLLCGMGLLRAPQDEDWPVDPVGSVLSEPNYRMNATTCSVKGESTAPALAAENENPTPHVIQKLDSFSQCGNLGTLAEIRQIRAVTGGFELLSDPQHLLSNLPSGAARSEFDGVVKALSQVDLRVSFMTVIEIVAEVLSPEHREDVRWMQGDMFGQCVPLIDFVENELSFLEFMRFLLRAACRIEDGGDQVLGDVLRQLPSHRRLDAYLRHVFLPALSVAYKSPEEKEAEKARQAPPPRVITSPPRAPSPPPQVEKGGKAKAKAKAKEVPKREPTPPPPPEPPEEPEPPKPEFWRGFDDLAIEAETALVPRCWPDGYEQEIAKWSP